MAASLQSSRLASSTLSAPSSDCLLICVYKNSLPLSLFFKVFIEFYSIVSILWLVFFFFWPGGMWDFSSSTRDWNHTPCAGRWSLSHWTTREVPLPLFCKDICDGISDSRNPEETPQLKVLCWIVSLPCKVTFITQGLGHRCLMEGRFLTYHTASVPTIPNFPSSVWQFLTKLNIRYYTTLQSCSLIFTQRLWKHVHTKICTPMFIAAVFIIAETWKQPRHPSISDWIDKLWHTQTVGYYSAIKRNELSSHELEKH